MNANKLYGLIIIVMLSCSTEDKIDAPGPKNNPNIDYSIKIIEDQFNGLDIILAGSETKNIIVSFYPFSESGELLHFEAIDNKLPVIMKDESDNEYNIFGEVVTGPNLGFQLQSTRSSMGYYYAFNALEVSSYEHINSC